MPATLIKNLRATARLKVYDFTLQQDSMKLVDVKKKRAIHFMVMMKRMCSPKLSYCCKEMGLIVVCVMKK